MFSEKLRQLRLNKKLTQSDMAKALNISRVAYTNYELGNREPDFETVKQIAIIYKTSIDYLLADREEPVHEKSFGERSFTSTLVSQLPHQLQKILINSSDLSCESREDLERYIELLLLRDNSHKNENNL